MDRLPSPELELHGLVRADVVDATAIGREICFQYVTQTFKTHPGKSIYSDVARARHLLDDHVTGVATGSLDDAFRLARSRTISRDLPTVLCFCRSLLCTPPSHAVSARSSDQLDYI